MTQLQPRDPRDSCGFGLIAQVDGDASHWVVDTAITALSRLTHRGAVASDGQSGDGCGLLMQFPTRFLEQAGAQAGIRLAPQFAAGMVFMHPEEHIRNRSKKLLADALKQVSLSIAGWREVPIDVDAIGPQAQRCMPRIEQVFVNSPPGWNPHDLERQLFVARHRAGEANLRFPDPDPFWYVASLSNLVMVYKGLICPDRLADFYTDLKDECMQSAICVFHQRFSTNTLPNWKYAQPFRFLAHNGEINSIAANRSWAATRAAKLKTPLLPALESFEYLVNQTGSDSSSLDNMLEVLLAGGMDVFRAMRLLMPPAWENRKDMDPDLRAFFEFNSTHMEPWDGPAGVVMTDGRTAACTLDRNGLRPARYVLTRNKVLTIASEVGVWDYAPEDVIEKGRLGPGEMLAVDIDQARIWRPKAIDDHLKSRHPYREWLSENVITIHNNDEQEMAAADRFMRTDYGRLLTFEKLFGVTIEEKNQILKPLAKDSAEAVGSMGDDTPIAVLSRQTRSVYDYFRQQFAQVTNPPIDPLRESAAMSLGTSFGRDHNVFSETTTHAHRALVPWPVLNYVKYQQILNLDQNHYRNLTLSLNVDHAAEWKSALEALCEQAVQAVREGVVILVLTDRDIDPRRLPLPAPLAVGAVHQALIRERLRCDCNIILETATARDPHHFAVLMGLGTTAVYPYLAYQMLNELHKEGRLEGDLLQLRKQYRRGIRKGMLKILSKMGISTIASYRGAQLFEAVGISREITDLCCPGAPSRIGGSDFADLKADQEIQSLAAWSTARPSRGGLLKYVHGGEFHAYNPDVVTLMHAAVGSGEYADYEKYRDAVNYRPISSLRDMLQLRSGDKSVEADQVETVEQIVWRFDSAAMSVGALSPEAHQTLAEAMNALGGRSNSGEGGEDPQRYGTNRRSRIKQVASGRFGVTAPYLIDADVLQIKVAQGAKPGEGGQLPGHKVTPEIAALRFSRPGVTLISPPPHHDIYSIEDLAQLIFDLKQVNPTALVSVKLVSAPGVGTIAVGVAKAYADLITIAGHDGGTGASPLTSVKYAGIPWEIGLAEAHEALVANDLRHKIRLQVDGGLKTGLDVVKAAMLGAESFGFGTAPMIAMGCKYLRICHLNNCATGVATQDSVLRQKHFAGDAEKVMRYFRFVAQEVRELLTSLGFTRLQDIIGRSDLLVVRQGETDKQRKLDLGPILKAAQTRNKFPPYCVTDSNQPHDQGELNQQVLRKAKALDRGGEVSLEIRNYDRAVGASLAGWIAAKPERQKQRFRFRFEGSAGQTFGAWCMPGMDLKLVGDANDYVGKGMHGGRIVVTPPSAQDVSVHRSTIVGNTCLYGATGGELFAAGQAGERFAVRNSGAVAVIEGVGHHGCEYMTGGTVVVLGEVGPNFAAGMTGGRAFVLDREQRLAHCLNPEFVTAQSLLDLSGDDSNGSLMSLLTSLIQRHAELTGSAWARRILNHFDQFQLEFQVIQPTAIVQGQAASEKVPVRLVKG
ncbi:MAG: glutamate synthase large subunit [Xanthomonadales bacterium]|nr:glutamate synthase large subunit [Xanthomonadales bacterium]